MGLAEMLLPDVKNYLDITWPDPENDKKLAGIIERGITYLNRIGGGNLDYVSEIKERELLFDYCRYVRDNALASFESDYLHELLALQIDEEVRYAQESRKPNV